MNQSSETIVVETASLSKRYQDFWGRDKVKAVDDLNLQINRGEVFGLLGPNGSGKTTTIKMLLGLLYPTSGRARVFGKAPTNVEVKSRIGYLPEETRLYQFLDSWETLDFYGRIFNLPREERMKRTEALVEMVGLGPAASRPVGQYSKGMARRIGLAQSLINDPDLLILDEPTSGLDPIGTRQIKDLLIELKKRGKTILLSSHLLADVEDVCDRVAIMYGGKLLCCGKIEELLAQQEMTQILTENLNGKQLNQLEGYLRDNLGCRVISVGSPRDRLEQFFLRMVRQAQEQLLTTSGALTGGVVSDFLRSTDREQAEESLLEKLVEDQTPAQKEDPATPELPERREPEVERDMLEELTREADQQPPAVPQSPRAVSDIPPRKVEREQVDHDVLKDLIDQADDTSSSQENKED